VWPKKVHGFGMASAATVLSLPFHSVDATNWELAPCGFGNWHKFGQMSVRGSSQDLRSQVLHYLDLEAKARVRWEKEMAELDALPEVRPACAKEPSPSPQVANADPVREGAKKLALGERRQASAPGKKREPGEMDKKWQDYWKQRA